MVGHSASKLEQPVHPFDTKKTLKTKNATNLQKVYLTTKKCSYHLSSHSSPDRLLTLMHTPTTGIDALGQAFLARDLSGSTPSSIGGNSEVRPRLFSEGW